MDALEVARQGAICLAGLVQRDGSFRYRFDHGVPENKPGYNVLRHAGAIWSILDVYRETREQQLLESGKSSTTYLLDNYLRFFQAYRNVCICEDNRIKLGGNALAILAVISLFEITGDRILLTIAEHLAEYMVDQRDENGDLIHKRYFQSGKISAFKSMYYTGEALLALLAVYRITRQQKWLDAVTALETMLATEDYGVPEQSHWMLYALSELSQYDCRQAYYRHAAAIVRHILDHPDYLDWQRSTPIACRTEGLMAFMRMARPAGVGDNDLLTACWIRIQKNLDIQLQYMHDDGSFIRGGDDDRMNEVRIDYIQHNISSFLHYHRFVSGYIERTEPLLGKDKPTG